MQEFTIVKGLEEKIHPLLQPLHAEQLFELIRQRGMFLRRAAKRHHNAVCLAPLLLLQKGIQLNNSEQILLCQIIETPKRQLPLLHAILDANGDSRHRRTACLR